MYEVIEFFLTIDLLLIGIFNMDLLIRNMRNDSQESLNMHPENLRKMLSDISIQLSTPYSQKRALNKTKNRPLLEQLQDAIAYLSDKEKELQVSLDISKYLLESNELLHNKVNKLKENQEILLKENQDLLKEIHNLEQGLKKPSETTLDSKNFNHPQHLNTNLSSDDLIETQVSLQEEVRTMKSNKKTGTLQEFLKKDQKLLADNQRLELNMESARDQYDLLSGKYKTTLQRLKETERMQKILMKTNETLKKKCRQTKGVIEKCKSKISRLEEDAKLPEFGQMTKTSEGGHECSLLSELQKIPNLGSNLSLDLSDEDIFQHSSPQIRSAKYHDTYSPLVNKNFFGKLEICALASIDVKPMGQYRKSIEEYFVMVTQAVKMNLKNLDRIGMVPHSFLYNKAQEEHIPFHQWHLWIEKQLSPEHVQLM